MPNREFDTKTETRSSLSRQVLERQRDEHEARDARLPQRDPFVPAISGIGDASSAGVHASMLNRATNGRPSRAGQSLLRLQRQYGNRYVQRVLALARKGAGETEAAPELEQSIQQARGGGHGIDSRVRGQMESAFGADFGGVRVHTGTQADALNKALNARAFTTGQDIFFGEGEYNPRNSGGRELLAHELTHVVQQTGGVQQKMTMSKPGDRFEQEADRIAKAVAQQDLQKVQMVEENVRVHKQVEEEEEGETLQTRTDGITIQRQMEEEGAHEITHVLQQVGIVRRNPVPEEEEAEHWIVQGHEKNYLRASRDMDDYQETADGQRVFFQDQQNLELMASEGDWLQVRGEAYVGDRVSVGVQTGWIRREWTNISPQDDVTKENLLIQQDLDNFLDVKLIPTLRQWEKIALWQAELYRQAFQHYSDVLTNANQQAKRRADIYAAVLTAVSAGALGWLGDATSDFAKLYLSAGARGALEDALQSSIGEWIDIEQGGWPRTYVNRKRHPSEFKASQETFFKGLDAKFTKYIGNIKRKITLSKNRFDRPKLMLEIYNWWNGVKAKDAPPDYGFDNAYKKELRRGFMKDYVLHELVEGVYWVFGGPGRDYKKAEKAIKDECQDLGFMYDAGITEWSEWYEWEEKWGETELSEYGTELVWRGDPDTQKLATYLRRYELKKYGE